ncbi:hypothetical protein L208DRAFT_1127664, partial [Tricholoma matsutake]
DTIKAQVMVKIDAILKPPTICYDEYNISFVVPRYSPQLMPLDSAEKYDYMVEHALKAKASPAEKLIIEAKIPTKNTGGKDKENIIKIDDSDESDSETEKKKKKKKKQGAGSKVSQILLGNKAMNNQIGLLRARWRCPTDGGKCGSEHCFIQADSTDHFLLGFRELESWAAAILKGPQYATIDMPPNNALFDTLDPRTVAAKSPLLQCRL